MKKFLFPLVLAGMIGMSSCSEDFEVAAPYKQVTVVYAMLNPKDTAHYVRVQKAFLDERKSAIDMAKVSDSSFYKEGDIDVILEEIRSTGAFVYPLTRVNMATEGYPKDAATSDQGFFSNPHYAYKTTHPLNSSYKYNVKVINKLSGETVETTPSTPGTKGIGIVSTSEAQSDPTSFYIKDFFNADYFLNFERTTPASKYIILGRTPANAVLIEGVLRFRWVDKNTISGAQVDKSVDYFFADTVSNGGDNFLLGVPNLTIYSFLADAIGPAPANTERYMDSCDIIVWAGSQELDKYQKINLAQGSGITGDQIKPNYTNLTGSSTVLGLIASRTFVIARNVPLGRDGSTGGSGNYPANYTIDSLRTHPITSGLNIKGRSDH